MKVAILGSGPAGLFAAQAAINSGATDLTIFSNAGISSMYGAQYLHKPIPGLPANSRKMDYQLVGDVFGYRHKVYGAESAVEVSPVTLEGSHEIWDIRAAYRAAWNSLRDLVVNWTITPSQLSHALYGHHWVNLKRFDLVVSSIPRRFLCSNLNRHIFNYTSIWAAGSAPELGIHYPPDMNPSLGNDGRYPFLPFRTHRDIVICSGVESDRWYRASRIFGRVTIEWPLDRRPIEFEGMKPARVVKPISHTCTCFTEGGDAKIIFVGRYGKWEKGVLSHDAYFDTEAAIRGLSS